MEYSLLRSIIKEGIAQGLKSKVELHYYKKKIHSFYTTNKFYDIDIPQLIHAKEKQNNMAQTHPAWHCVRTFLTMRFVPVKSTLTNTSLHFNQITLTR
jgi:hypothetical protein